MHSFRSAALGVSETKDGSERTADHVDMGAREAGPRFVRNRLSFRKPLAQQTGRSASMFYERLHVTFVGVLATLVDSVVVAEFAGYWLHRLLHSDKIPALSRGHLIHHFLVYGPRQPMRAHEYRDATDHRFSVGNVGLEWLVPSGVILLFCWGVMALLHVPHAYEVLALFALLGWPILMFSYLHDRMHVENYWMTRVPVLRTW